MADDDDKGNLDRFGWTHASDIEYLDDDGNWVRGGPIPDEVKDVLKQHEENKAKAAKQTAEQPTEDARQRRARSAPKVRVHIHRGR